MKKIVSILLLVVLLLPLCNAGSSMLDPAYQYKIGLAMLRAYLSSNAANQPSSETEESSLEAIVKTFEQILGHAQASGFYFYAQALDQIEKNNFDSADFFIGIIKNNDSLNNLLNSDDFIEEYGAIHPVEELEYYAKGRRAEAEGDYAAALSNFLKCQNFYDSASRVMQLSTSGIPIQTAATPPTQQPAAPAVTAPPQPQPTATLYGISQNEVNSLNWTAVAGATQYTLEKRLGTGAYSQVYSGSATSYTDTSVIGSYQYTYRVTARLFDGTTVVSNEVSVMTSAAPHTHTWVAATCTAPKTCSGCGATEGSALGHNWKSATCTKPKTCSRCGATSGSPLGHNWTPATESAPKTCTRCGATEGSPLTTVTEYRYRDSYQTYTAWSAWSNWGDKQTITDSNLMEEESKLRYGWWAAQCTTCGHNTPYHNSNHKCKTCGTVLTDGKGLWNSLSIWTDDIGTTQSIYGKAGGRYINGEPYWRTESTDKVQYRYRTRQLKTEYGDWSSWSTTKPASKDGREIQTRTVTR